METRYSNEFGTVQFEIITPIKKVSELGKVSSQPVENTFSIDVAEQIALTTENRMVQIVMDIKSSICGIIIHETGCTGAWGRITNIMYNSSEIPREAILRMRQIF